MKEVGITAAIKNRIKDFARGVCFSRSDFANLGTRASVSQVLSRMERKGELDSPLHGYYCLPLFSSLLKEPLPPDYDALAQAIARNSGWVVLPCGNIALNELGLSTQVPVVWTYVSTGPYRNYDVGATKIAFKHATGKDLFNMSRKSAMVVQALKALGKSSVDEPVIARLRNRLNLDERRQLERETMRTTSWIFAAIQRIAKDSEDE